MSSHSLLNQIDYKPLLSGCIVEIGSARESLGPDSSTFYFNKIALDNGATFFSCDFSSESHALAKSIVDDRAFLSDGKVFLDSFTKITTQKISILYLDNFDIIYNEVHFQSLKRRVGDVYEQHGEIINNQRSAEVHLEQMIAALSLMADKSIVIVDDTKQIDNGWWGKGALVVPFLLKEGYKPIVISPDGVMLVNF
jgi:hypothetical protein